jgi:DNA-binding response OmpR family regulator
MDELLARLRAALRRSSAPEDQPIVRATNFTIDLAAKRAHTGDGRAMHLTPTEWHLLEVLFATRTSSSRVANSYKKSGAWPDERRPGRTW